MNNQMSIGRKTTTRATAATTPTSASQTIDKTNKNKCTATTNNNMAASSNNNASISSSDSVSRNSNETQPIGEDLAGASSSSPVVNFMSKFRDKETRVLNNLNSQQFIEVWNNYDKDGNGYIEGRELDHFLREFVASVSAYDLSADAISNKVLAELKQTFLEAYDENSDGKIDIREANSSPFCLSRQEFEMNQTQRHLEVAEAESYTQPTR